MNDGVIVEVKESEAAPVAPAAPVVSEAVEIAGVIIEEAKQLQRDDSRIENELVNIHTRISQLTDSNAEAHRAIIERLDAALAGIQLAMELVASMRESVEIEEAEEEIKEEVKEVKEEIKEEIEEEKILDVDPPELRKTKKRRFI